MQTNALVPLRQLTEDQLALIKRQIMPPNSTDDELALFKYQCERTGLDPFARQIHAIKRSGKLSIEPSIDGFRLISERTGNYAGMIGPYWCADDGNWRDVWLNPKPPSACKVRVLHKEFKEPVWGIATYLAYVVQSNPQWRVNPSNQLAICAERQARRKAFPMQLSGLYGAEEMEQVDNGASLNQEEAPAKAISMPGRAGFVPPASTPDAPVTIQGWQEVDGNAELTVAEPTEEEIESPAIATPGHCTLKGCGGEIALFTSTSTAHPGREFWMCEKAYNDRDRYISEGTAVKTANVLVSQHYRRWADE